MQQMLLGKGVVPCVFPPSKINAMVFFLVFIVLVQKFNVNYCFITVNSFEVLIEDNKKETCYDI